MKPSFRHLARGLVILLVVSVTILTWTPRLDQSADQTLDTSLSRAFITFATARGLNAAVSAVQGTEVSLGVGASATLSVGEVLDPVNDLVEQFADLMLLATVSLGIQQVLLSMGQHAFVKLFLTAVLVLWGSLYVVARAAPRWLSGLLILALMARFAIPLAAIGNDVVFRVFLEENYMASESAIGSAVANAEILSPEPQPPAAPDEPDEQGWIEELKGLHRQLQQGLDVGARLQRLEDLRQDVEETAEHVVNLIVVFLLQTLIMPLVILWALYMFVKGLLISAGRRTNSGTLTVTSTGEKDPS
ncbi:MAG: hypothetical protein PVG58_01160 [Gammaproteobacteria bacterium]|jgi:hypothetical protein